jgi:hypothetical protein
VLPLLRFTKEALQIMIREEQLKIIASYGFFSTPWA